MKKKKEIKEIFAFIAEDEEGEGIMGARTKDGWLPLIGADIERVDSLIPLVEAIKKSYGTDYKIIKFSTRTDVTKEYKK